MITAKTRSQLAAEYGVSRPTFCKWLKKSGLELPPYEMLTPQLVAMVYNTLGVTHYDKFGNTHHQIKTGLRKEMKIRS